MTRRGRARYEASWPEDIELAFNPDEPRGPDGRWSKVGAVLEKVADALDFPDGLNQQSLAQHKAADAFEEAAGSNFADDPDMTTSLEPSPEQSWGAYQCHGFFEAINNYLRNGKNDREVFPYLDYDGESYYASSKELADNMVKAFDTMGHTTTAPATFYRAVHNVIMSEGAPYEKPILTADTFKVGEVWSDKGVLSTSAARIEVAGVIDDHLNGEYGDEYQREYGQNDSDWFLMEIHAPTGTRILGGMPEGIETMFPPGQKFRVVEKKVSDIDASPTGSMGVPIDAHTLTTVVLEATP